MWLLRRLQSADQHDAVGFEHSGVVIIQALHEINHRSNLPHRLFGEADEPNAGLPHDGIRQLRQVIAQQIPHAIGHDLAVIFNDLRHEKAAPFTVELLRLILAFCGLRQWLEHLFAQVKWGGGKNLLAIGSRRHLFIRLPGGGRGLLAIAAEQAQPQSQVITKIHQRLSRRQSRNGRENRLNRVKILRRPAGRQDFVSLGDAKLFGDITISAIGSRSGAQCR